VNVRVAWLVACILLLLAQVAHAQRYAVVIGNNLGHAHEPPLQFAERDATRVADLLTSIGSVAPERLILASGSTAQSARRSLIAINERIRSQAGTASMLVVYYSGHGDADSLHLGSTSLPLAELEGLVRGSAARVRILIIDACRSGDLVRAKGGRPAPAIRIQASSPMGDGVIVLTATAAGEDAHESPSLEGSFFTHHLVSGLLGAADADADGQVTVTEVYDYAYANTLRDSSATVGGPQHPSYRYDLRGQGDVVLTEIRDAAQRAQLVVPADLSVLVMRGSATGAVIAEGRTSEDKPGTLSLPPGRVFIRARTPRELYEQQVTLRAGQTFRLATSSMDRIDFARLARKGGSHRPSIMGVGLSVVTRRGVSDARSYCSGGSAHAVFMRRSLSLVPRLGMCRESFQLSGVDFVTSEAQLAFALNVHRDLSPAWSAHVGPELGFSYFRQALASSTTEYRGRNVYGGALTVQAGMELALGGGLALSARALAQTYFLQLQTATDTAADVSALFAWGATVGVTWYLR
jgi:Caspase domain